MLIFFLCAMQLNCLHIVWFVLCSLWSGSAYILIFCWLFACFVWELTEFKHFWHEYDFILFCYIWLLKTCLSLQMVTVWYIWGLLQMPWFLGRIPDPYTPPARQAQLVFIHECTCGYIFHFKFVHFSLVMDTCNCFEIVDMYNFRLLVN